MQEMTVEGSVNLYDEGRSRGTATEKGLAARMGGHTWNIINNDCRHEIYFTQAKNSDHPLFLGDCKTKFPVDSRNLVGKSLRAPDGHKRENALAQRRTEVQLAQLENCQSYRSFQHRCNELFPPNPPKRYSIENKRFCHETEKLRPKEATKQNWLERRGEQMTQSISCPSLNIKDPAGSLDRAMRQDPRKHGSQLQTESDTHASRMSQSALSLSMDATKQGREKAAGQKYLSVHRVENHDWSVTRKNNHFSGEDRTTKCDPYFMRPRVGITNNSVKYDIVSNQRKWFKY